MKFPKHRMLLPMMFLLAASTVSGADTGRPKISGISFVRFKSTDLDKAAGFYSKILGLRSESTECRGIAARCYGVNESQWIELTEGKAGAVGSFLDTIGLWVGDVQQMQKFLSSHGVATSAISRGPSGLRSLQISDPEGNKIVFIEQPGIAVAAHSRDGSGQISSQLIHAGFVVKNLDLMKKFYVDLLEFRLYWYGGFKDDGVDWYEIQVPDGNNWIEFMLNISPSADRKELGVQNHFSLGVKNVHAAAQELRAHGATTFDGPEVGRDGKDSLDIYDPDSTRVEIMDLTPSKEPCCHAYTAPHPKL